MTHILDNPIWNALVTGNSHFSCGDEHARCFGREVAFFAGSESYTPGHLKKLYDLSPPKLPVVLFTPDEIPFSDNWKVISKQPLLQMVFEDDAATIPQFNELVPLAEKNVEAMIELTTKTKPGPFFSRTIEFGNYMGIFDHNRLVAMAGQRLQPGLYTEISAVCTHPEHTGKGYAAKLLLDQVRKIKEASRIPFLHLLSENIPAHNLYKKLGFKTRREMLAYAIEKQ